LALDDLAVLEAERVLGRAGVDLFPDVVKVVGEPETRPDRESPARVRRKMEQTEYCRPGLSRVSDSS
jgi:hypothetical protein